MTHPNVRCCTPMREVPRRACCVGGAKRERCLQSGIQASFKVTRPPPLLPPPSIFLSETVRKGALLPYGPSGLVVRASIQNVLHVAWGPEFSLPLLLIITPVLMLQVQTCSCSMAHSEHHPHTRHITRISHAPMPTHPLTSR